MTLSRLKSISLKLLGNFYFLPLFALLACATAPGGGGGDGLQKIGGSGAAPRMPDISSAPPIDPKNPAFAAVEVKQTPYCSSDPAPNAEIKLRVEGYLLRQDSGWKDCLPGECRSARVRILTEEGTTITEVPTTPFNGHAYFFAAFLIQRDALFNFCLPALTDPQDCLPLKVIPMGEEHPDYRLPGPIDKITCVQDDPTDDAPGTKAD